MKEKALEIALKYAHKRAALDKRKFVIIDGQKFTCETKEQFYFLSLKALLESKGDVTVIYLDVIEKIYQEANELYGETGFDPFLNNPPLK